MSPNSGEAGKVTVQVLDVVLIQYPLPESTLAVEPVTTSESQFNPPAAGAIVPDTDIAGSELEYWMKVNTDFSLKWPVITIQRDPLPDADTQNRQLNPEVPDKRDQLSETPGLGD